jgi:hypothetical protein
LWARRRLSPSQRRTLPGDDAGFANGLSLVRAEIVDDDDVARAEGGDENLLDVLEEALAIDGAVDEPRCGEAIVTQSGQEGHGRPAAVWCLAWQPLPAEKATAILACLNQNPSAEHAASLRNVAARIES